MGLHNENANQYITLIIVKYLPYGKCEIIRTANCEIFC